MNQSFEFKRVLVTGACGTVGRELVRQLLETYGVEELIGIDNDESELFFLEHRFSHYSQARFFLADIRDKEKLFRQMRGVHIVFHAAAFKHVVLCERSPYEAVQTNIVGLQNVITAAYENRVQRVIFTSSDKAVNPTNVMGTSKLMGERLITAANSYLRGNGTIFSSTRFGNVLGSRGSVIPIFRQQIKTGGPVTITDSQMTRFIMSIQQAVRLVIDSTSLGRGGCVFITKMPVIRIQDLAESMIEEMAAAYGYDPASIHIETIGIKPGEKMYEELMTLEETRRTWELPDYFAVLPAFKNLYRNIEYNFPEVISKTVTNPYQSVKETPLSKDQLRDFLISHRLLHDDEQIDHPAERMWPKHL